MHFNVGTFDNCKEKPLNLSNETELIGKGSFNRVYKTGLTMPDGNKTEAVFRITYNKTDPVSNRSMQIKHFFIELRGLFIQSLLDCENVCKVYDFGFRIDDDGKIIGIYAFLEYLPFELFYLFNPTSIDNESIRSSYYTNLEKMIGNTEKMGNVILGVTNALKFIHERHIAHSDIKLENICLSKDGIAKLVDFGLSRYFKRDCVSGFYGTPGYVDIYTANNKQVCIKSDIYSLGIVLFESFFIMDQAFYDTYHTIGYQYISLLQIQKKILETIPRRYNIDVKNITKLRVLILTLLNENIKNRVDGNGAFDAISTFFSQLPEPEPEPAPVPTGTSTKRSSSSYDIPPPPPRRSSSFGGSKRKTQKKQGSKRKPPKRKTSKKNPTTI